MIAYCPECGSEVAPNTTFCSYCGIALQPMISINDTPTEPDAASHNEMVKEMLPEVLDVEANKAVSAPKNVNAAEIDDLVPPTPFALGQDATSDKLKELGETDSKLEKDKNTFESWSTKTDPIDLDESAKAVIKNNSDLTPILPLPVGIEPVVQNQELNQFQAPITPQVEPDIKTPVENQFKPIVNNNFSAEAPPVKPVENSFSPEIVEKPVVESIDSSKNTLDKELDRILSSNPDLPIESVEQNEDNFIHTIPYNSADYAAQSLKNQSDNDYLEIPVITENKPEPKLENPASELNNFQVSDSTAKSEPINPINEPQKPFNLDVNIGFVEPPLSSNQPPVENNFDFPVIPGTRRENVGSDVGFKNSSFDEPPKMPISEPLPETPFIPNVQPNIAPPVSFTDVKQEPVGKPPVLNIITDTPQNIKSGAVINHSHTSPNISTGDTDGNKAKKLKPLEEGTILNGRYEVVRKIGGGGMGAVYLASDKNLGGVLRAVKEMVQSSIEDEQQEKAINDFKREATILSGLEHSAIPTIFDYFFDEVEGRFYLVMRYISGGDLAGRLRAAPEGKIDESTVTDWGIQVADVLNYLHKQEPQIVYRDLKPSNIMIDGNTGRIMLIDFGIARLINSENADVTAVGTMGYAPPELYRKNVEPRSDIFSLGATMFHLLTGADPQSNPLLIFDFNKNPRPRQINSQLSDQIEQILMRSVELDAANRFASASEMRDTLATHLDNLLKGAVTYGVVAASSSVQAASTLPVFCGFCGQKIVATDQFCPFCGSVQPSAGKSSKLPSTPAYSAPKMTAKVRVIGTNDLNTPEFNLDKETNLVGRRDPMSNIFPEVDLSKFDPQTKISRKHARIWREKDMYMLEDLGSSNGTLIISPLSDSVRLLPRQPHVLANGDKIKVGDTTLHFLIG